LNRNTWMGIGAGLLGGFLLGYFLGSGHFFSPTIVPAPTLPTAAPAMPPAATGSFELQQQMFMAQQAVEREPGNLQAWVALGNGYFDLHQYQKAIEAYGKALELDPKNPDVLTDQGIMYRETKAFDKAIANFEKANKLEPKHVQSLYNLGIVYAHDMNAPDKAIKLWKRVIEIAPTSKQAEDSRKAIEELKGKPRP